MRNKLRLVSLSVLALSSVAIAFTVGNPGDAGATGAPLEAYAAITKTGEAFSGLYSINLTTGAATLTGRIGSTTGPVTSLAVR